MLFGKQNTIKKFTKLIEEVHFMVCHSAPACFEQFESGREDTQQ